jgi:PKD repeat protein
MKRFSLLVCAFVALLAVSVGCGGGDGSGGGVVAPPATQMTLVASSASPITGSSVALKVTANNSQTVLKSVSIDFTNDGTWDEEQFFDQSSITATFNHVYVTAGTYTVRAEVKDANNTPTSKTLPVMISAPINPPVSERLSGGSSIGPNAVCYHDLPGGSYVVINGSFTRQLGTFPHGSPVSATESFRQDRIVNGQTSIHYSCGFDVTLYAGTPGSEVQFAQGACTTTSFDPERLTCSITASGTVP